VIGALGVQGVLIPKSLLFGDIVKRGDRPHAVHILDPDDLPTGFVPHPHDSNRSRRRGFIDPKLPGLSNGKRVFDDQSCATAADIERPADNLMGLSGVVMDSGAQRDAIGRFTAWPTWVPTLGMDGGCGRWKRTARVLIRQTGCCLIANQCGEVQFFARFARSRRKY